MKVLLGALIVVLAMFCIAHAIMTFLGYDLVFFSEMVDHGFGYLFAGLLLLRFYWGDKALS